MRQTQVSKLRLFHDPAKLAGGAATQMSKKDTQKDGRGKNPNSRANLDRGREIANSRPRRRRPRPLPADQIAMFCQLLAVGSGRHPQGMSPQDAAVKVGLPAAAGDYLISLPEVQARLAELDIPALQALYAKYPRDGTEGVLNLEFLHERCVDMVNQAMLRKDTYAQIKAITLAAVVLGVIQTEGTVTVNQNTKTNNNLILPNGAVRKTMPEFRTLTELEKKILEYNNRANNPGPAPVQPPQAETKP
jgi:hypothetical protein